jgi:hypothetical protein
MVIGFMSSLIQKQTSHRIQETKCINHKQEEHITFYGLQGVMKNPANQVCSFMKILGSIIHRETGVFSLVRPAWAVTGR